MHAIQPARHQPSEVPVGVGPFPWEEAHAAPEDRAVGLELELIELVCQRRLLLDDGVDARALDREIDLVVAELGALTPSLPLAG